VTTLLRLITPDPDRLPIWIWIVATSLIDELLVTAMKFGEVAVGRAVVVFQKRIPRLISLDARPRPTKKRTGEKVEKRMMIKNQKSKIKRISLDLANRGDLIDILKALSLGGSVLFLELAEEPT
jgi:hypothetical protein